MDESVWATIVAGLRASDPSAAAAAAERLHTESSSQDVPKLLALLESADFFIREAVAWPLAELQGPAVLRELLVAYQRGLDDGRDNDGFTAALLEIPALHPSATRSALAQLAKSSGDPMRGHAEWLLTFCEGVTVLPNRLFDADTKRCPRFQRSGSLGTGQLRRYAV